MHRPTRLKVTDINPHFTCVLCDGYLIDATTIVECLHSFCRTCIVRYLENSRYCPVCDVQVHKTKPLLSIRSDKTLQDIVFKLVPGLYQNEMQRRREFYAEHPEVAANCSSEERGEGADQRCFYSPEENISLTLEYLNGSKDNGTEESQETSTEPIKKDPMTRYLNCPAAFSIGHLKKFLSLKFSLPPAYMVEITYADHILRDDYTLMDIAYIYAWKRAGPMKFHYHIEKRLPKRPELPAISQKQPDPVIVDEPCPVQNEAAEVPSTSDETPCESKDESEKMDVDEVPSSSVASSDNIDAESSNEKEDKMSAETLKSSESDVAEVQKMDVTKPEAASPCVSTNRNDTPVVPVSTAETVPPATIKLVTTLPESTVVPTANGVKLKLVHHPELNPEGRPKKLSSKKGGRSSRYKSAPVQRFARLAPYPPPSTVPATCLPGSNMSHLSHLAIGKLVPSVMTSLAPSLVTALVSSTVNTPCSATRNNPAPMPGPFQTQATAGSVSTHQNSVPNVSSNLTQSSIPPSSMTTRLVSTVPTPDRKTFTNGLPGANILTVPPVQNVASILPAVSEISRRTDISINAVTPRDLNNVPPCVPSTISQAPLLHTALTDNKVMPVSESPPISNGVVSTSSLPVPDPVLSNVNVSSVKTDAGPSLAQSSPTPVSHSAKSIVDSDKGGIATIGSSIGPVTESLSTLNGTDVDTDMIESMSVEVASSVPEVNQNGVSNDVHSSVDKSPAKDSVFCGSFSVVEKSSEAYKMNVKNSISAEFSDNDDLGCQPDLVVDEQKMDSSDNEDETDAALRKKITAIAEKEDEADDTEADSGRASDISSQARSSCDDDVGSPMPIAPTAESDRGCVTTSASSKLSTFPVPITPTAPTPTEEHRHTKSNNINHVINNLYRHHEKKDTIGALDLSTCTRKAGQSPSSRPKAVANPVLDTKHRQQTYLPAPSKPHTACVPSPKHPTSSPLLMHGLTAHHHNLLPSQIHGKASHLPVPFHPTALGFPSQSRAVSSPSCVPGRSTPTYNTSHSMLPPVPTAHQGLMQLLPGMVPCMGAPMISPFAGRSAVLPGAVASRPTPSSNHLKTVSSPPPNLHNKVTHNSGSHHAKQTSSVQSRKSSSSLDSHRGKSPTTPNNRNSAMLSPSMTLGMLATYPKSSPSAVRLSPHHRSASPAPNPKHMVPTTNSSSNSVPQTSSYKMSQPSTPIYSKKSDSYKSYNCKFKGSNLAVINPDPNGYRQKIVIRNLDVRPNSSQ